MQWKIVENGYKVPKTSPKDVYELTKYNTNSKARNHILNALDKLVFVKVMHYTYSKQIRDKLQTTYEGGKKVKTIKPQTYIGKSPKDEG